MSRIPSGVAVLVILAMAAGREAALADGARVDALLGRLATHGFSGAVSFAGGGRTFRGVYGRADVERDIPLDAECRFEIASVTKPFTAALILRLEELGVLSVRDSLGGLLPDVPADKRAITIHQLLTHTSGLVRDLEEPGRDRTAMIAALLATRPLSAPGERFEYSNAAYDLLAALAERKAQRPFEVLMDSLVIAPAGLARTGYRGAVDETGQIAWSYRASFGVPWLGRRQGPSRRPGVRAGSGGLVSTIGDLQQWASAMQGGRVVRPETWRRMTSAQAKAGGESYGYGWFVGSSPHGPLIYHGGDNAGYKAMIAFYPQHGLTYIGLACVLGWERVIDEFAVEAWFGKGPAPPPAAREATASELAAFAGTFATPDSGRVIAWADAGVLGVEVVGQGAIDAVFGISGDSGRARSADAGRVNAALDSGRSVDSFLRFRDRAAGMSDFLIKTWNTFKEQNGGSLRDSVLGSWPAQDNTVVTLVELVAPAGKERLRYIWRGDRLATVGGASGLRRPTTVFRWIDRSRLGRFDPTTGGMVRLSVSTRSGRRALVIDGPASRGLRAEEAAPLPPPIPALDRLLTRVFLRDGMAAGLARLDSLRSHPGTSRMVNDDAVNDLGYRLLHAEASREAVAVFEREVEWYPDSWNAHDSLGEALVVAGMPDRARVSYRESLRLNPGNDGAKRALERLGAGPP